MECQQITYMQMLGVKITKLRFWKHLNIGHIDYLRSPRNDHLHEELIPLTKENTVLVLFLFFILFSVSKSIDNAKAFKVPSLDKCLFPEIHMHGLG